MTYNDIREVISRMTNNNTTVINYNINYLKSVMYTYTLLLLLISYLYANSYDLRFNDTHNVVLVLIYHHTFFIIIYYINIYLQLYIVRLANMIFMNDAYTYYF